MLSMLSQLGDVYDKQSMTLKPKKMMEEKERESFTRKKTEENDLCCWQKREKASREREREIDFLAQLHQYFLVVHKYLSHTIHDSQ